MAGTVRDARSLAIPSFPSSMQESAVAVVAVVGHAPSLAAAALGHASEPALQAAGLAVMAASGAVLPERSGWPTLVELLAQALASVVPAIWAVLIPSMLSAILAGVLMYRLLAILSVRLAAVWACILVVSPAILAVPNSAWDVLAATLGLRVLLEASRPGVGGVVLVGLTLAILPFISPAILPAIPFLLLAGWLSTHSPLRRDAPAATAILLSFPLAVSIAGTAYASWALGSPSLGWRAFPPPPATSPGFESLVALLIANGACAAMLLLPPAVRSRHGRGMRLAAVGLLSAAILASPLGLDGLWVGPAFAIPGALGLLAANHRLGPFRAVAFGAVLAGSLLPALLAPPPFLEPLRRAWSGETPTDAPWRAAIDRAPTLLEPEDATLAAFAWPGHVLPPGSPAFRDAEAGRWEAPQAIVRIASQGTTRLGHANPSLRLGPPEGYRVVLDDRKRLLLRRITPRPDHRPPRSGVRPLATCESTRQPSLPCGVKSVSRTPPASGSV